MEGSLEGREGRGGALVMVTTYVTTQNIFTKSEVGKEQYEKGKRAHPWICGDGGASPCRGSSTAQLFAVHALELNVLAWAPKKKYKNIRKERTTKKGDFFSVRLLLYFLF